MRGLAKNFGIADRAKLGKTIDFATRIYHSNKVLSKEDLLVLRRCLPELNKVFRHSGGARRIADFLVRLEKAKLRKRIYDPTQHAVAILAAERVGLFLDELDRLLREPNRGGHPANVGLHAATRYLEGYWRELPGKRVRRNFTPRDQTTGRPLAKSESMRFLEAVMQFIDPAALAKLSSVTRHRLNGKLPKPRRSPASTVSKKKERLAPF